MGLCTWPFSSRASRGETAGGKRHEEKWRNESGADVAEAKQRAGIRKGPPRAKFQLLYDSAAPEVFTTELAGY